MAEDIRDMFIVGTVAEFKKKTGADIFLRRGGLELLDTSKVFAVGGYTKVFSIDFNEPVLAANIVPAKDVDRPLLMSDKKLCYCISKGDTQWNHFENGKIFFPGPTRFARILDEEFLTEVNIHWKGRHIGYVPGAFEFGPYSIFRNLIDGDIKAKGVDEGVVVVARKLKTGGMKLYCPATGKPVEA